MGSESFSHDFPLIETEGFHKTSEENSDYNCIAWAAGIDSIPWWPVENEDSVYWPKNVPFVETIDAFEQAYATIGYSRCGDGDLEDGYEKIALYADESGLPQHAARQKPDGTWTSKIGLDNIDINHQTLRALESSDTAKSIYGKVARYLKRRVHVSSNNDPTKD